MTAPAEQPVRFADNLGECDMCGEPIVAGLLCVACQDAAEEWAGLAECDPRCCHHAEDSDAA